MNKPNKAQRRLLLAAIKAFTLEWKMEGTEYDDEFLCDVWMDWVAVRQDLIRHRLDWLGFCILGPFSGMCGSRSTIRSRILQHANRCLK